jgi:cytochrome c-type biogenesis protein CcmH/NrfG
VSRRVAAAPDDAAGQALLGLAKDLAGDGDGALAAYRAALFLRPALYRVRFQLAERLRQAGWRDRARTEYRSVLASLEAAGEELPELVRLLPGTAVEIAARCRAALAR